MKDAKAVELIERVIKAAKRWEADDNVLFCGCGNKKDCTMKGLLKAVRDLINLESK